MLGWALKVLPLLLSCIATELFLATSTNLASCVNRREAIQLGGRSPQGQDYLKDVAWTSQQHLQECQLGEPCGVFLSRQPLLVLSLHLS